MRRILAAIVFIFLSSIVIFYVLTNTESYKEEKERSNLEEKAKRGDAASQYKLGKYYEKKYYESSENDEENYEKLIYWYGKAGVQDDLRAQVRLCTEYYSDSYYSKDHDKAKYWCEKGAQQGDAYSLYKLGTMYGKGLGVRKDLQKRTSFYMKAAKKNYVDAQLAMGNLLSFTLKKQAKEWYGKACDNGSQEGCNKYASM